MKSCIQSRAFALIFGITISITTPQLTAQSQTTTPGLRLKLPVGTHTPAITMGLAHGIILASDGSRDVPS